MILDDIDLERLASDLRDRAPSGEPKGYLRGKLTLRELVIRLVGCSELEAEELVDTMESRGYLRFHGDPTARSEAYAMWSIEPGAEM